MNGTLLEGSMASTRRCARRSVGSANGVFTMFLADFHLPRRLRGTAVQLAKVICPPELESFGLTDHVIETFELGLRAAPASIRRGLVIGLIAFELGATVRYGRPFSKLAPAAARAWYESWWSSPIGAFRQLARGTKAFIVLAFYDSAPMRAKLSYHPDRWIAEAARRRLERYGVEIGEAEGAVTAPDPLLPAPTARRRHHA